MKWYSDYSKSNFFFSTENQSSSKFNISDFSYINFYKLRTSKQQINLFSSFKNQNWYLIHHKLLVDLLSIFQKKIGLKRKLISCLFFEIKKRTLINKRNSSKLLDCYSNIRSFFCSRLAFSQISSVQKCFGKTTNVVFLQKKSTLSKLGSVSSAVQISTWSHNLQLVKLYNICRVFKKERSLYSKKKNIFENSFFYHKVLQNKIKGTNSRKKLKKYRYRLFRLFKRRYLGLFK